MSDVGRNFWGLAVVSTERRRARRPSSNTASQEPPMSRAIAAVLATATALLVATALPAGAAVLPADTTALLSGQPDLLTPLATPAGAASIGVQAIDRAGDKVVFTSTSDGLSNEDDDSASNVYVENLATGAIQLVSRRTGAAGAPSHTDCGQGAISADGNAVAFMCTAGALDDAVKDRFFIRTVYLRDLANQTTTVVSRADGLNGAVGDGDSGGPAVSADGSFVTFNSDAPALGPPFSSETQVFRRDVRNGRTVLFGQGAGFGARHPGAFGDSISDDGQRAAFSTGIALDRTNDTNEDVDVYVHDFTDGTDRLASRADGNGPGGDGFSDEGIISGDGKWVVFRSAAANLVGSTDTDHSDNLFLHNVDSGATLLTGLGAGGKIDDALPQAISPHAQVVAFADDDGAFVYGTGHQPAERVAPAGGAGGGPPAVGMDSPGPNDGPGKVVIGLDHGIVGGAEPDLPSVVVRNLSSASTQPIARPPNGGSFLNAGGDASGGSLSADGRYAVFTSKAPGLGVTSDEGTQVFRRDLVTGAVTRVSLGPDGAVLKEAGTASIDADGRRVAFVAADPADRQHVYVRDIVAGQTFAADVDGTGAIGPGTFFPPDVSISDDGLRVAFRTDERLLSDDTDGNADVYVRDVEHGRTLLVDRASGAGGAKAANGADDPQISGDGHSVVFDSFSSLDPQRRGFGEVYVRHIDGDFSTTLASIDAQGRVSDGRTIAQDISRDGSRILFFAQARDFGPYASSGDAARLYLRDLRSGTLTAAGAADGRDIVALADGDFGFASGFGPPVFRARLSADGQHVVFAAEPETSIAPGAPDDQVLRIYERDVVNGTTRLMSRQTGATGAPSGARALTGGALSLTADGGCVAFDTNESMLSPPGGKEHAVVLMRVVEPNCGRPVPAPPSGPGPSPPAGPAVLSGLSVKPARFFVGGRKGGARIVFRLDRASSVTLTFSRLLPAHRKGKRCLTTVRKGKRCTVVRVVGRLTVRAGRKGSNTLKFSGKLGRKALARGSYRLTATPSHGRARTATFAVVRAPTAKPKPKSKRHGK
jgi:Tol biopolymer transport system component